jgi:bifunctional isochorismate lyase/aryl carrier protein
MPIPRITSYPMPTDDELPPDTLRWPCRAERATLLVHDMQRYFVRCFPPRRLPVIDLVANIARLIKIARAHDVPVIYTAQPGSMTPQERGLLADVWGPGMASGVEDRAILPELSPAPGEPVLTKWRYSAFSRSPLAEVLGERDQLVVCGVYAHVGCLMTAADAFSRDIRPFLVADAIADFDLDYHRMALRYAAERCARTLTTARLLDELTAVSADA